MTIQIDSETIRVTTDCKKAFSCLNGDKNNICGIGDCVDGKVRFIRCADAKRCSYQVPFGSNRLCSCPTRKEIHAQYGF